MKISIVTRARRWAGLHLCVLFGLTGFSATPPEPPKASSITILVPRTGARFTAPGPITIEAEAVDPLGDIRRVDFYSGERLIGTSDSSHLKIAIVPGRPFPHQMEWKEATVGTHRLIARGKDTAGKTVSSPPVTIEVGGVSAPEGHALVRAGTEWRWRYEDAAPADGWRTPTFDDSTWKAGKGKLGFGEDGEATVIWSGKAPVPVTAYFRRSFEMPADLQFSRLHLRLLRDDGAVVYLNGREIVRDNMPAGTVGPRTLASSTTEAEGFRTHSLSSTGLVSGRNVIAVEVHQASTSSSDLGFDLDLTGVPVQAGQIPTVGITASRPTTAEPAPHIRVVPGQFTIHRTGPTTNALTVGVRYSGTARAGLDYTTLPAGVVIPLGHAEATLEIMAIDDELVEESETVTATLAPAEVANPNPLALQLPRYLVDAAKGSATVTIMDSDEGTKSWLLNVNFGLWTTKTGAAATGNGPGDYWNPWEHVYLPDVTVKTLRLSTGAESPVTLRVRNAGGSWNNKTGDGMYDSYVYPNSGRGDGVGEMLVTLTGVPTGTYDLFLYGHGDPDGRGEANSVFTATAGAQKLGPQGTVSSAGWKADQGWREGAQYVAFRGLKVAGPDQPVEIIVAPGFNGVAVPDQVAILNGLQLIESRAEPPAGATLRLTSPASGTVFESGRPITLTAVAIDPVGYISRVTFHDGEKLIGVSEITFIRAPDPGTPIEHTYEWTGAAPGEHKVAVRAVDTLGKVVTSPPVVLQVGGKPWDQVVLEVTAAVAEATEPGSRLEARNGVFLIQRTAGSRNVAVHAAYVLEGTATNGIDYARLSGEVTLPAGRDSVEIVVRPLADAFAEGAEKVVLMLRPIPCIAIFPPPPECYRIGERDHATVTIRDASQGNQSPRVAMVAPRNGAVITLGEPILIKAEASDADGSVARVDIVADGKVIGSGTQAILGFEWKDAARGTHKLVARAIDNQGAESVSTTVTIHVRDLADLAFVKRELPPAYLPGGAFEVVLLATPPKSALAWTVEDVPPSGWTIAATGADAGVDAGTGRVRFGPFTDSTSRRLVYTVTPAAAASGPQKFTGSSSLDGQTLPVTGEDTVGTAGEKHPADATPADGTISADELTTYAGAWKSGRGWGADGPIPLVYVTRAGQIWRQGGRYTFRPALGAPPECWAPGAGGGTALAGASFRPSSTSPGGTAVRQLPGSWKPGTAGSVRLVVTPAAGAEAIGVEEFVPAGWRVAEIAEGGAFDAATGRIRWGLLFGDRARELGYSVVPPADAASNGAFAGRVSFDGRLAEILGSRVAGAADAGTGLRISGARRGVRGRVHLRVEAVPDQVFVVEASPDLVNWSEIDAFVHTGEELEVTDPGALPEGNRYYRLRPVGR